MDMKLVHTPVKKKPNMRCEAILMSFKMLLICAGKAIVAPESSSFKKIETGLNQYSPCGFEQLVIPSLLYPSQKFHRPTW